MDSIADMLVRMENALRVRRETVDIPHSKIKEGIVRILLAEGYISKYDTFARLGKKYLRVGLKYTGAKKGVIEKMGRVSKPSRRIYVGVRSIPRVQAGYGTAILSTSKGLMTDAEAREKKLGGEVLLWVE